MALTLEDIAKLSKVSRSTVSRVINGDNKVSEETRQRVLDVIQLNNYQPNIAARRLAAGKTNVIGLVIPIKVGNIFNDPYFSLLIQGISAECNLQDYSLMLWLVEPEFEQRTIRQIINNGMIDGVVISSSVMDDPIINTLQKSSMPFVLVGKHPFLALNCVDIDNRQAAYQITTHLLTCIKTRTRPAIITGPKNNLAALERLKGFMQAANENGFSAENVLVCEGDFNEKSGYGAMQQILPAKPDSIFIANDLMAAGAYRAIHEAGLIIPDDIAIVGFDDISLATQLDPPLTTIRQPIQNMGSQAVQSLISVIHQTESLPIQIILPSNPIIRKSCGCVK
ncbi:MAG: LacI family DNA-binding transcriptional regulator [Chloroflexota bacterium]